MNSVNLDCLKLSPNNGVPWFDDWIDAPITVNRLQHPLSQHNGVQEDVAWLIRVPGASFHNSGNDFAEPMGVLEI